MSIHLPLCLTTTTDEDTNIFVLLCLRHRLTSDLEGAVSDKINHHIFYHNIFLMLSMVINSLSYFPSPLQSLSCSNLCNTCVYIFSVAPNNGNTWVKLKKFHLEICPVLFHSFLLWPLGVHVNMHSSLETRVIFPWPALYESAQIKKRKKKLLHCPNSGWLSLSILILQLYFTFN